MSLFDRALSAYKLATAQRAPKQPRWSTVVATCAAQCGQPVVLGEPHFTVDLNVKRREYDGTTRVLSGDWIATVHLDCWPSTLGVVIEVTDGDPHHATVRPAVGA